MKNTKKTLSEPVEAAIEKAVSETTETVDEEPATVEGAGFCCYIGPSIIGAVQQNQIFEGSVEDAKKHLAAVITKRPAIARLIVDGSELASARALINTPGNRLYEASRQVSGK